MHIDGDRAARLSLAHSGTLLRQIPDLWLLIRRSLGGGGFFVPSVQPRQQKTSSHYASSLPLGSGPVAFDASIAPEIYICDSSVFPSAPATSPTFTIMANARRIAYLSLKQ
jgi:choline dehydrogenase-like flavoprotein